MLHPDFVVRLKEHHLMNKPVRNIIFDLGNVVIRIDPDLTLQRFRELGVPDFDAMYTIMKQSAIFDSLDTGKISPQRFRDAIRRHARLPLTDRQIDEAWCAMLLDFPEEHIALLRKLRSSYKLYLLSNTNRIHMDFYLEKLRREKGSSLLPELFDRTFYSHEIGYRKPDRKSFEHVLQTEGLKPAETLFIDDLEHNVAGARRAGIQAYHFPKGSRLSLLFAE
ncbi:MAG: HAD family phosphatase [Bacteroidales bacterium]|jgi:putative hydrolase of the HAD superfamily|nr:HAD family phosphatase [Bacteroidales bacterium]